MLTKGLPPASHYEYFSHLLHGEKLVPFNKWEGTPGWEYPRLDRKRFETLFLTDPSYYKDCRVLDLGCHSGYFSYITKYLGAKSVHGINARQYPLDVANYAYTQLDQDNFKFDQGDIEDLDFLKEVCKDKDTLIMTLVMEHLRNPYAILETISKSNIKNFILESGVFSDEGQPSVGYYQQTTESPFTVYHEHQKRAVGSCPNVAWFDMMLYYFGWKVEYHTVDHMFNENWFAVPNVTDFPPVTHKSLTILCKKFE